MMSEIARAEPIRPALRPQTLRPARPPHADFTHVVLIRAGQAHLHLDGEEHLLGPDSAAILPAFTKAELVLSAGSSGWLLGAAPQLLTEAVGTSAESVLMQRMCQRFCVIGTARNTPTTEIETLAGHFHTELTEPARGSPMAAASWLALILIAFRRDGGLDDTAAQEARSELRLLQDFRRLVELNFRKRRSAADYAAELGLSYDRLHAICTRTIARAPLQLIHQRLVRDAVMRLERSGEPIQAIAYSLGFRDATQFSHFFKRSTTLSPSECRRQAGRLTKGQSQLAEVSFADWP